MPDIYQAHVMVCALPTDVPFPAVLDAAVLTLRAAGFVGGTLAVRLGPRDAQAWDAWRDRVAAHDAVMREAQETLTPEQLDALAWAAAGDPVRGYLTAQGIVWIGYGPTSQLEGWT